MVELSRWETHQHLQVRDLIAMLEQSASACFFYARGSEQLGYTGTSRRSGWYRRLGDNGMVPVVLGLHTRFERQSVKSLLAPTYSIGYGKTPR